MTTEEIQACRDGYIYIHDMSARRDTMNCCLFNVQEVLKGGFDKLVETMEGKIAAFGGGLPVRSNGIFLGALGVSGGTSEEDIKIAEYAVNAVFG